MLAEVPTELPGASGTLADVPELPDIVVYIEALEKRVLGPRGDRDAGGVAGGAPHL